MCYRNLVRIFYVQFPEGQNKTALFNHNTTYSVLKSLKHNQGLPGDSYLAAIEISGRPIDLPDHSSLQLFYSKLPSDRFPLSKEFNHYVSKYSIQGNNLLYLTFNFTNTIEHMTAVLDDIKI